MRPFHLAVVALAMLSGTAGYITHRALTTELPATVSATPASPTQQAGLNAAPAAPAAPLEWRFENVDGEQQALARYRGELTVVNFWATWCPPCLKEIPAFVRIQENYADKGVRFIGVALDQRQAVEPFLAERSVNYPMLIGDDRVIKLMQILGNEIGGLPYTVVFAADGEVIYRHQGEWEEKAAIETLETFMN